MDVRIFAACAEFPNDNPSLHAGAIWACGSLTGPAEPLLAPQTPAVESIAGAEVALAEVDSVIDVEATSEAPSLLIEADDFDDDIEIVDEIPMDDAIEELSTPVAASEAPPSLDDPFSVLVRLLEDVARTGGATDAGVARLRAVMGRERLGGDATESDATLRSQAAGWQAILCENGDDFEACGGGSLDEWSALVVCRALGETSRVEVVRRDLRRRGVAAFGLVVEAA